LSLPQCRKLYLFHVLRTSAPDYPLIPAIDFGFSVSALIPFPVCGAPRFSYLHLVGAGERRMSGWLKFKTDSELEPSLITSHAGLPSLIDAYCLSGAAAVVERTI
jgi:hypothetical protein